MFENIPDIEITKIIPGEGFMTYAGRIVRLHRVFDFELTLSRDGPNEQSLLNTNIVRLWVAERTSQRISAIFFDRGEWRMKPWSDRSRRILSEFVASCTITLPDPTKETIE
jgi:hypothetical protein